MVPATPQPFKFSKPALALILASSLLAAILAVTTVRNMNRGEQLLQSFLIQESLTLIRSFEAGARTSMIHHQEGSEASSLQTLVEETTKEKSVAYIRIVDENGRIVAESGDLPLAMAKTDIKRILNRKEATTRTLQDSSIFELARIYEPLPALAVEQRDHRHRTNNLPKSSKVIRKLIMVGLTTHDFEASRKADRNQTFLMGALLFLLGSAGLYFLFLYQSIQVSRSTLANMKIYTENVIESMPAGLITIDPQGLVVSSNSRAEQLLSRDLSKLKGTAFKSFFPELNCNFNQQQIQLDQNILYRNAAGEEIPLKLASSPLLDHNGCNNGLVIILRDMREIKKIEQQLELSRRLASLGRMAAGVAHEIRNPLGTLRGFAQYFSREAQEGTNGKRYADLMISEVDRLNYTISSLLQFARAREPSPILIKVEKLFKKVACLMETDFAVHQITFSQHHDTKLQLFVDPDLLLQVLLNLLKNSINATDRNGTVELTARQVDDEVVLTVSDNGCGMTTEEKQKLFDPFFSTRNDGTGLGLAVSHQIIEQHNGRFEVESLLDQGTRMQIILPGEK